MATKRWHIFQDDENLGMMTAKEIRDALRDGRLDPFDCVLDEADGKKKELVEVSEIFALSKNDESVQESHGDVHSSPSLSGNMFFGQKEELGVLAESDAMSFHGGDDPFDASDDVVDSASKQARADDFAPEITSTGLSELATAVSTKPTDPSASSLDGGEETQVTDKPDFFSLSKRSKRRGQPGDSKQGSPRQRATKKSGGRKKKEKRTPDSSMSHAWSNEGDTGKHRFAHVGESKLNRRKAKRFQLIDSKGRVLGPLSPTEIQALYQRQLMGKNIKVRKTGEDKTIAIHQFIAVYSGERIRDLASGKLAKNADGIVDKHPSRVIHELQQLIASRKLTRYRKIARIKLAILGFVIGAAFFGLFEVYQQFTSENGQSNRRDSALLRRQLLIQGSNSKIDRGLGERPPSKSKEVSPSPAISSRSVKPKNQPRPHNTSRPRASLQNAKVISSVASLRSLSRNDGSAVTVGPLRFSLRDLKRCKSRCELLMRDRAGRTVVVVFQKESFSEKLAANSQAVFISGEAALQGRRVYLRLRSVQ